MSELVEKTQFQEDLDECTILAEYILKDEDFTPEKIPTPVVVISPPKLTPENAVRKSERNSQGAITRSLQNS